MNAPTPSATPPTPAFSSLPDLLAQQAHRQADQVALQFDGQAWRYGQLHARSQTLAQVLRSRGIVAGDRVAWLGLNHPVQMALLFALTQLQAVLVPLNYRLAPAELQAVLADCTPRLLVHDKAFESPAQVIAAQAAIDCIAVDGIAMDQGLGDQPTLPQAGLPSLPPPSPTAPALLVYTSGTTGKPKGAVHTQAMLLANMAAAVQVQALTPQDRVLTVLPLFHVGGLCIQTLPALYAGATVLLQARFDAAATLASIATERPTLTLQVPATLKALIEHAAWADTDLSTLRAVWAGSSLLPPALLTAFEARGLPLCNVYGATETGPFSIALPPEHTADHAGSCGWPAPGVEVHLSNVQNGVGQVLLRAPNVVAYYWPDVPATDADGWFHTGDLAAQAPDGSYTIVGRAKDMVISGGENIYPAEVENALTHHPAVAECAVLGLPDARWGEVLAAVLVLHADTRATDEDLTAFLAPRLARYKLPRHFLRVDSLPRTALGKVQKKALQALFNS